MARRLIEKLADLMWDKIAQQTDAELLEIISECKEFTIINCGWQVYRLKDLVAAMAENILQLRWDAAKSDSNS